MSHPEKLVIFQERELLNSKKKKKKKKKMEKRNATPKNFLFFGK